MLLALSAGQGARDVRRRQARLSPGSGRQQCSWWTSGEARARREERLREGAAQNCRRSWASCAPDSMSWTVWTIGLRVHRAPAEDAHGELRPSHNPLDTTQQGLGRQSGILPLPPMSLAGAVGGLLLGAFTSSRDS